MSLNNTLRNRKKEKVSTFLPTILDKLLSRHGKIRFFKSILWRFKGSKVGPVFQKSVKHSNNWILLNHENLVFLRTQSALCPISIIIIFLSHNFLGLDYLPWKGISLTKIPQAGLDKFTCARMIFWACNFTCAPDRARKKIRRAKSKSMCTSDKETTIKNHFCSLLSK